MLAPSAIKADNVLQDFTSEVQPTGGTALSGNGISWREPSDNVVRSRAQERRDNRFAPSILLAAMEAVDMTAWLDERKEELAKTAKLNRPGKPNQASVLDLKHPVTLKSITAGFVRDAGSEWSSSKSSTFNSDASTHTSSKTGSRQLTPEELRCLTRKGYSETKPAIWAEILLQKDSTSATRALFREECSATGAPFFLINFMLRRTHISAPALRYLLLCSLHYLRRALSPADGVRQRHIDKVDQIGVFHIFLRLLHHARLTWPESIPCIASIITSYLPRPSPEARQKQVAARVRTTRLYNRGLHLLALRTRINPVRNAYFQQVAQFDILAGMASASDPISITEQGYQAIVQVQLLGKKSAKDERWARLKYKGWPPWKEAKNRLDEDIGLEQGMSNAQRALASMEEAGYFKGNWGHAASLLAGWDTDGIPTIQSRSNPRRATALEGRTSTVPPPMAAQIWSARVKATRTLHQAWACFLEYEKDTSEAHQWLYESMFERVIWDSKRSNTTRVERAINLEEPYSALPGDGLEVEAPPTNPVEAVYTASRPPSFEQLLGHMHSRSVKPSGSLLQLILANSPTFDSGIESLIASNDVYKQPLLGLLTFQRGTGYVQYELPNPYLSAFVQFLCRFPDARVHPTHFGTSAPFRQWPLKRRTALLHAIILVHDMKPDTLSPWLSILGAITTAPKLFLRHVVDTNARIGEAHALLRFQMARSFLASMIASGLEADADVLRKICVLFTKAVLVARSMRPESAMQTGTSALGSQPLDKLLESYNCEMQRPMDTSEAASDLLAGGSQFIRLLFQSVVCTSDALLSSMDLAGLEPDAERLVPRIANTPNPSTLHAYVLSLGALGDFEGLLSLVKWMRTHSKALNFVAEQEGNGRHRRRGMLVAIRVLLEYPSDHMQVKGFGLAMSPAPEEIIALAREEMAAIDGWLGWPTDDEVREYCSAGTPKQPGHVFDTSLYM